jgi:hypothetical protein
VIKLQIALGSLLATAALAVAGPSAAVAQDSTDALSGNVTISVHAHSNDDPNSASLLFPTDRLAFDFEEGDDFAYSSRPCGASAPFNDIGLDFTPDYPGIDDTDDTAAVRHLAEGTVTSVDGDRGTIEGTITSVVCVTENGQRVESGDAIVSEYTVRYRRTSDNEVQLTGTFRISPTRSTGTFEDMTGRGSIKAVITCLGAVRDPDAPTCAELGYYTDFVGLRGDTTAPAGETTPGLIGSFRDPTIESD